MEFFFIMIVLVSILAIIQKNTPENPEPRIKLPEIVKKAPEERFVDALSNISSADKVVLKNVKEKWSLRRNLIDDNNNHKLTKIAKDVIDKSGINSGNDFYIKNIENVYIMKDKDNNFRAIMDFFVFDVQNFHTVKIILDVVSIERIIYINHIDIDESGIKNVIKNYDIRTDSHGILSNYNMFDEDTRIMLDNYYRENYKVVELDKDDYLTERTNLFTLDQLVDDYLPANVPVEDSPMFCKGVNCAFENPSYQPYPNTPYQAPGVVTNNVYQNDLDWAFDLDRGLLSK